MEKKKSMFKKVDGAYTKFVKWIIGEGKEKNADTKNISALKNTYSVAKDKLLNIGTPNKKELLYKEVVKREKKDAKEVKRAEKQLAKDEKATLKASKKSQQKSKATSAQKATKKPAEKKPAEKKTASKSPAKTTKKKVASTKSSKKESTVKKTATKKVPSAKANTSKKETSTKVKAVSKKDTSSKKTAEKKSTPKKPTSKSTTKEKVKPAKKSTKREEKIALYTKDIKKHYGKVDEDFLFLIVKNLGPSIYKTDAELVSCSDPKELDTVRKNFLVKKLGMDESKEVLDAAIKDVCTQLKGVRRKYRATFYYTLAKKFKKESALS
jgi:hypothetical protein